jgi:hypothetical protein
MNCLVKLKGYRSFKPNIPILVALVYRSQAFYFIAMGPHVLLSPTLGYFLYIREDRKSRVKEVDKY